MAFVFDNMIIFGHYINENYYKITIFTKIYNK